MLINPHGEHAEQQAKDVQAAAPRIGRQILILNASSERDIVPSAAVIAALANPRLPESARTISDVQEAARTLGRQLLVLNASSPSEINAAFATLRQQRAGALLVGGDPFFTSRRQQIVALTARDAIPDMYTNREFVEEGGLMSYGNDTVDAYRRAGLHVGTDFQGRKARRPAGRSGHQIRVRDQPETAKALGLDVPPSLLARADEVIE